MRWIRSHRADAEVVPLADRHYNRQKIGSPQFAPPGRCLVLKTAELDAFWITSWPFAEYVRHAWAGAWVCSAFRNESAHLSSDLIREKRDPGRCYLRAGFKNAGMTKGGLVALQLLPSDMPTPMRARDDIGGQALLFEHEAGIA